VLTGYGNGNLQIKIPKNSNLGMYGTYELERGSYQFSLKNAVNKKFEMDKGGTVDFNGDINKARLNLNAVYELRTSTSDLISEMINSSTSTSSGGSQLTAAAQARIPVDLLLNLTGNLDRPVVNFDIRVKDPDPSIKSYIDQKLNLLKANQSELYKEVFGLLVMNRFIPSGTSVGTAITTTSNLTSTASNTVSDFVSSQLSNYLSNLLEYANIQNLDVNIGFHQYDPSAVPSAGSTTTPTGNEVQVALSQRLLNNRLSINAGGNLDVGGTSTNPQATTNKSVIPTGDVQVEYSLTPEGIWRAKVFNRTNYDYYYARNTNKTGVGISYRQEFDKPSDLFKKKKKIKKEDVTPAIPNPGPATPIINTGPDAGKKP
jgi:hypothetical protein